MKDAVFFALLAGLVVTGIILPFVGLWLDLREFRRQQREGPRFLSVPKQQMANSNRASNVYHAPPLQLRLEAQRLRDTWLVNAARLGEDENAADANADCIATFRLCANQLDTVLVTHERTRTSTVQRPSGCQ